MELGIKLFHHHHIDNQLSMQKILIVEDETVIRSALRRLLERHDYRISEAGSVKFAIENFDLNEFDLIISDLRLPGAPGTDLIKHAGEVPVLIMTSYASLRSAVESMKSGAVDYISKPFDHDEMLASVSSIISNHIARRTPETLRASVTGRPLFTSITLWSLRANWSNISLGTCCPCSSS